MQFLPVEASTPNSGSCYLLFSVVVPFFESSIPKSNLINQYHT